jgi:hypothetical protein
MDEIKEINKYVPDLIDIENLVIENYYEDENLGFQLFILSQEEEYTITFEGNFFGEDFKINATIAIEKHKSGTHNNHHLNFQTSDSKDFLFKGKVHFNFQLKTREELDDTIKGFIYAIYESIKTIERTYNLNDVISNRMFKNEIKNLKEYLGKLHLQIERSIENDQIHLEIENSSLVEFKTKLSTVNSDMKIYKKLFLLARIIHDEEFFKPFIAIPTYKQISKLPSIKKLKLSTRDIENKIESDLENNYEIHKYTPKLFYKKYVKSK